MKNLKQGFLVLAFGILLAIPWMKTYATSLQTYEKKPYHLSICAIFTNEAKQLKEWIEYHRLIGVEHFYLYNNGSDDSFMHVLTPYIKKNLVTLTFWPDRFRKSQEEQLLHWALSTQVTAYENAIALYGHETEWLICTDISEFLAVPNQDNLLTILQQYQDSPGILLKSDFFDVSQPMIIPQRKLVIETVERIAAPVRNPYIGVEKMIFRPSMYAGFVWPPYQCVFVDQKKPLVLRKCEVKVNYYANRFLNPREAVRYKHKLQMDTRQLPDYEVDHLLDMGYEIEDEQQSLHHFKAQLMKKLGYD